MTERDRRFMELMQSLDRLYEEYARARGMTYMSMTVLDAIYERDDVCTQKQLCEETRYPKQSINQIIKAFWESGYVALRELPADRRNKQIVLTEKGKAYAGEIIGKLRRVDEEATNHLTERQQDELLRFIGIYGKAYEEGIRRLIEE